jgi:hypothetical protein
VITLVIDEQRFIEISDIALMGQSNEQIPILAYRQLLIEAQVLDYRRLGHQDACAANCIGTSSKIFRGYDAFWVPLTTAPTVHRASTQYRIEASQHLELPLRLFWYPLVVIVEKRDVLSSCRIYARIAGRRTTPIRRVSDIPNAVIIEALDHIARIVSRCVVNYNYFQVIVGLPKDTGYRPSQQAGPVARRYDDTDKRAARATFNCHGKTYQCSLVSSRSGLRFGLATAARSNCSFDCLGQTLTECLSNHKPNVIRFQVV